MVCLVPCASPDVIEGSHLFRSALLDRLVELPAACKEWPANLQYIIFMKSMPTLKPHILWRSRQIASCRRTFLSSDDI